MTDYTLKFIDESDANNILESLDNTYSIDVIGILYKPDPIDDELLIPIDGWHVNVRGPEAIELNEWHVDVKTPARTWM